MKGRSLSTDRLAVGGLLIAMGILLPWVFHLVGGNAMGAVFLPMHLPVLLGGFLLGPLFGGAVGLLTPVISGLLTGMPAAAMLPFMMVELAVYGAAAGVSYTRGRLPSLLCVVLAQAAGRLVKALVLLTLSYGMGLRVPGPLTVFTAVATGLPGLLLQWISIPLLLAALKKGRLLQPLLQPDEGRKAVGLTDLDKAKTARDKEGATCVLCREGTVRASHLSGVRPLLGWLAEDPDALRGGAVADKVVGRAAAMLLLYGGIRAVYAEVMSEGALALLESGGVTADCGRRVPFIANRDKTGMCPMEQRVQGIDDPAAAFAALRDAVKQTQ